jgi:hypothetical protein
MSTCTPTCGTGFQVARHLCVSSYGHVAPLSKCEGVKPGFQICKGPACDSPYYTYTPWSPCSETCGGGVSTRTPICNTPLGVITDDSECSGIDNDVTSRSCNTSPCESYGWNVSAYSECDAPCGGKRSRTVSCMYVPAS